MDERSILDMISNGENLYVEFKEESIRAKELAEEFVAFANSEGGIVLIGVNDNGDIKGIENSKIEETIMNICRNNCIPHIIPVFEEVKVGGKKVAAVSIPKGLNKPYYTVDHKYYIRVGTTKRIASRQETYILIYLRWKEQLSKI